MAMNRKYAAGVLRALLFDFNGVLVDDEPLHRELFYRILAEEGLTLSEADYQAQYFGVPDRRCFAQALHSHGRAAAPERIEALIARKAAYYLAAVSERELFFPGVPEFVRASATRYPLAVVSGALRQEIEYALARGGLRACFQTVIAAEDVRNGKPDPEGFQQALALLNQGRAQSIQAAECLVIEDSPAGVRAARRAGMRCLAVTNSFAAPALREADVIVASLGDCELERLFVQAWLP
jgi:HAD superfamily hydrolase (TIGR01509 family)